MSGENQRVLQRIFCELTRPIIAAFYVRRSGPMKTRTEHHLPKWRSIVTAAKVIVDCLDHKKGLIGGVSTTISRITTLTTKVQRYLGFSKYRSCALLSMKDSTHDTMQVSVLCKRMTSHF